MTAKYLRRNCEWGQKVNECKQYYSIANFFTVYDNFVIEICSVHSVLILIFAFNVWRGQHISTTRCLTSATSGWTKPFFRFTTATECVATHLAFATYYMKEWFWCWWNVIHDRIQFFALSQVPTPLCWSHVLFMPLAHPNLKVSSQAVLFCRWFRRW